MVEFFPRRCLPSHHSDLCINTPSRAGNVMHFLDTNLLISMHIRLGRWWTQWQWPSTTEKAKRLIDTYNIMKSQQWCYENCEPSSSVHVIFDELTGWQQKEGKKLYIFFFSFFFFFFYFRNRSKFKSVNV